MGKKQVLGKGISALIPEFPETSVGSGEDREIVSIPVEEIEPNPHQARTEFDADHLEELKNSIEEKGVIQPIMVSRVGHVYQLIAGERRLRASKLAQLESIPAIIYDVDSRQDIMELSLIENVQRENLNVIEEAEGYHSLMNSCFLTQEEVAKRVGKQRSTIANTLRLLNLPSEVKEFVLQNRLQMGHARALLSLESDEDRLELGRRCVNEKMTVRDIEKAVKARRSGRDRQRQQPATDKPQDPAIVAQEERLQHRFGTAVNINHNAKKGQVVISYYGDEDLERILELLLNPEE